MRLRKACRADVAAIHHLIAHYAAQGFLLPRDEADVRAKIGHFLVIEERGPARGSAGTEGRSASRILGCVALEPYGPDLVEIRSLAVDPETRGKGVGARLLECALREAGRRKIARVFAVTHAPEFFARKGFTRSSRQALPEKLARDCCTCPRSPTCQLSAVVATLPGERAMLSSAVGTLHTIEPSPAGRAAPGREGSARAAARTAL